MSFATPSPLGFSSPGGLMPGILPVGADPINPLRGQPAVSGIGNFIAQIQTTSALRKLGLLPPTGPQAAAAGALGGAGGAGGLQALIMPLLQQLMGAMQGGGGLPGAAPPVAAPAGLNILA